VNRTTTDFSTFTWNRETTNNNNFVLQYTSII
jgi:hypothetical protein